MRFEAEVEGRVEGVWVGADGDSLVTHARDSIQLRFGGVRGDRHEGMTRLANARDPDYPRGTELRNDREVSVVSRGELDEIAEAMGLDALDPAWIGANIELSGVPRLTLLPPGTRLVFARQNAVLVVQGENLPCRWAGEAIAAHTGVESAVSGFPRAALHRRGIVCCVERPGYLSAGERVMVRVPRQRRWDGACRSQSSPSRQGGT